MSGTFDMHRSSPSSTSPSSASSRGRGGPGLDRPARLAVGLVSAGRVGAVLAAALMRAGHRVVAVSGVSKASLRRADELLPGVPVRGPDETAAAADLVLLAIPDDALPGTVRGLVETGSLRQGQIVAHTSGAHGVGVLDPVRDRGALPLALHPAMTFTGRREDLDRLPNCCFAVTAAPSDDTAGHVGEALVVEMGAEPVRVPESARPTYHAALTHGANHVVTLVNDAVDLLRGARIDEPERMLAPLLSAALDNALRHGDRGLTGPVVRGDSGTVRTHGEVLGQADPGVREAYVAMARRTAGRAGRAGLLPPEAAEAVRTALEEQP